MTPLKESFWWHNDYRNFYIYDAEKEEVEIIDEDTLREKLAEILKSK